MYALKYQVFGLVNELCLGAGVAAPEDEDAVLLVLRHSLYHCIGESLPSMSLV